MRKFISYYRVIKMDKKNYIERQSKSIASYVSDTGEKELSSFIEVTRRKRKEISKLREAIKQCKINNCKLVIPHIYKVTVNKFILDELANSDIEFVFIGKPEANRATLELFKPIADFERKVLSETNTINLNNAKSRGVILGNPNIREIEKRDTTTCREVRIERTRKHKKIILNAMAKIEAKTGKISDRKMAEKLNEAGLSTRRGNRVNAMTVSRARAA